MPGLIEAVLSRWVLANCLKKARVRAFSRQSSYLMDKIDMLNQENMVLVDASIVQVIVLLKKGGLVLKQKLGYKAGKLSASRNWCHIIDGEMTPGLCLPDSSDQIRTWKLFARFAAHQTPPWPWERPRQQKDKKPQGLIAGDDVWGVSYEAITGWFGTATTKQVIERLAKDLLTSFAYSHQRYC
jgi:hypothetical protein